jgi:septal ring factor EnvC (AmiA/AmiB activator)
MGFFNKKELAEIERLKKELVKEKAVNKEIEDLLRESRLDNLNLTRDVNNLNKILLEKEEDLEDLGDVLIAEQSDLKRLKKDVTTLGNTLKSATNELNDSTELIIKYKQALTEIAEYDFDRHKKAYLLNDFFQQRAKKALAEDE